MALQFGKVTGRFVAVVADSPEDSDSDPDVVPLQGVVTFTLKAPALLVPDAEPFPMTALPAPVSATLDNEGYLTLNGTRSVTLLASNGQHNPTSTTYEVKFSLKHGTISVPYSTFNISVPAGETINLTTVAPVPSSSGSPIVQGIGIKEVTADDGAFVFKMTNGTENRVGIPAIDPPATTTARCVQSVALDGSSLVFSFTDETVEKVDLSALSGGGVVVPPDTGGVTPTPMPDTIARRFVVLGDSHSDYTPPSDAGTWWWQVAADRAGLVVVDNFAARGWDTQQAIDGAEGKPSQLTRAEQSPGDLALVMFGGNDVVHGFTVDKYEANLATIINRLKASGKRVVIVFPPPLFSLLNLEHGTQYAQMRVRARAVAAENGAYYTDAWSVMASPEGTSDPSWDSGDTVHLNDEGQRVMGMAVAAALQSFAAVTDPLGGDPRTLDWARPSQHVVAGGKIVQENMFRDDQLFRSDSVARITGGTGETVVYAETGAKPGERIRVEYPYRVAVASAVNYQKGLTDKFWTWPGGSTSVRLGSTRVLTEGVRRYEVVVPAGATDNYVVGVGLVDTTDAPAEVLIGPARIAVVTPEGRPYRVVELAAPTESTDAAGETQPPGSGITPTPAPSAEARRAVVLGTSHSDKTWTQSGGVWWWQVAADLAGITVLDDYAVGGMDTEGALNGWSGNTPQIVAAEQSPADLALVEFGGNDAKLGVTPDVFRQRLTQLVIRLKAAGKRVVIVFPPPLFRAFQGGFGDKYATLRGVAREVAAANTAYYTDAWDAMSTDGGANPAYDSGDNMHLNGAGQLAWGRAVAADLQAFAGVTDPTDGVRDRYWFDPSTSVGDASQIAMGKNPDDALFHGRDGAVISAGAQDLTIFNDVSKEAGSRWEISYAYRVEAGSTEDGATGVQVEWPGPVMRDLPGRARLVGQEGVRRVEMVVPASATDACVAALRIPAAAKGLRLRVGQLGARRVA